LGFPTGWSFTTHKDLLLPRQQTPQLFSGAITKQHWLAEVSNYHGEKIEKPT
jgi:hypothetical protein